MLYAGLDIGGTKCAALLGRETDGELAVLARTAFPTPPTPGEALDAMECALDGLIRGQGERPAAIGVSCGSPLSSEEGLILSPPNLPGWDRIPICRRVSGRFGAPCFLQNDANACALAEWRFGAGRGTRNMIFLTFGTGMGAGLILDGRLYVGTNDMAGEIGHVRLAPIGPVGYGKAGSFEGFCSGGGFAQFAAVRCREAIQAGAPFRFCPTLADLDGLSAKSVAAAAAQGDADARAIYAECGRWLGRGLAILVDVLNPERIVIGSVYARAEELLRASAMETLRAEAIALNASVCRVVPAELGDAIGDVAALTVAVDGLAARKGA